MRVIRLNDGRMCYVRPARPKIELPPGQTLAFANLSGQRRSAVRVPDIWEGLNETELRRYVEDGLRERGRMIPVVDETAPTTPAPTTPAPTSRVAKRGPWWENSSLSPFRSGS